LRHSPQFRETAAGRSRARHHVVWRKPGYHKFRDKHDLELGDQRRNRDRHHAGDFHLDYREWFHKREPDDDYSLHFEGD
jgi:hypothetical protein